MSFRKGTPVRHFTIEERENIAYLFYEGYSLSEIGRLTGRSRESVSARLEKDGHHEKLPRNHSKKHLDKMIELYLTTSTPTKQITDQFGAAPHVLFYHLKKRGIPLLGQSRQKGRMDLRGFNKLESRFRI